MLGADSMCLSQMQINCLRSLLAFNDSSVNQSRKGLGSGAQNNYPGFKWKTFTHFPTYESVIHVVWYPMNPELLHVHKSHIQVVFYRSFQLTFHVCTSTWRNKFSTILIQNCIYYSLFFVFWHKTQTILKLVILQPKSPHWWHWKHSTACPSSVVS